MVERGLKGRRKRSQLRAPSSDISLDGGTRREVGTGEYEQLGVGTAEVFTVHGQGDIEALGIDAVEESAPQVGLVKRELRAHARSIVTENQGKERKRGEGQRERSGSVRRASR